MKPRRALTYTLYFVASLLVIFAAAVMPQLRKRPLPPVVAVVPPVAVLPPVAQLPPVVETVVAPPVQKQEEQPEVDVIFALDTTSSMSGLIEGAKRKIWSMVDFISSGQPQPRVRVGIVAYRDIGDAYVTRFWDLSDDIDGVFAHLRTLRAEGGGDLPEHVAKALHEAVTRPTWSTGQKVVKLIYVVGDAAGHTDYSDGYNANALARKAAEKGIHVNTIRCGDDSEAGSYFRQLARLGGGQYSTVEESGGVADSRTPYDDKLAALNRRLVGTAMGYGRTAASLDSKVAAAVAAPAAVAADRAAFAARNKLAVSGDEDLVNHAAGWVNSLPAKDLPAPIAALAPAEREEYVAKKKAERSEILAEISTLARTRSDYMKHAASARPSAPSGFDDHIRKSLADEAGGLLKF